MGHIFYGLSRVMGAITMTGAVIITAVISPWSLILGIPLILLSLVLLVDSLRMNLITRPAFDRLSNAMPSISTTEREALEAGTSWWEKELFMGAPDWDQFDRYPYPHLSEEEQSFLDHEVEQLCDMLDEWQIHHHDKDLPEHVWQFIKEKGF